MVTKKQNKKLLEAIEDNPTREELLYEWTMEVATDLISKKKISYILNFNAFVKSKISEPLAYDFIEDRSEKKCVCKWIKEDLLVLQKCLDMINKGKAIQSSFRDFEQMFIW